MDETIDALDESYDNLEEVLEQLLSRPLEETLAQLSGPAERAKLLLLLAYAIHSCSWVFLKLRAVDSTGHASREELGRVQAYNAKIKRAMESASTSTAGTSQAAVGATDTRNMKLDKEAADRFIKAAISNQPTAPSNASSFYTAQGTVHDPLDGPGKHTRLSSFQRQAEQSEDSSSSDESGLIVHGEDVSVVSNKKVSPSEAIDSGATDQQKKKGKSKKRKRPSAQEDAPQVGSAPTKKSTDPLSGYDAPAGTELSRKEKKRLKKIQKTATDGDKATTSNSSAIASPAESVNGAEEGQTKKKKKKSKKSSQISSTNAE